jgi:hypothetical protein
MIKPHYLRRDPGVLINKAQLSSWEALILKGQKEL